jgi:hypothetical protein
MRRTVVVIAVALATSPCLAQSMDRDMELAVRLLAIHTLCIGEPDRGAWSSLEKSRGKVFQDTYEGIVNSWAGQVGQRVTLEAITRAKEWQLDQVRAVGPKAWCAKAEEAFKENIRNLGRGER